MGLPFFLLEESFWRIRCVLSWTLPRLPFFFLNTSSFSNISQPRLSLSRYGHGSHEWPRAITATLKWCLLTEILNLECTTVCSIWLWNLPVSRCAGAGILNIFLCIHCDFDASLFAPKKRYEPFTIVISLSQYSVWFTTTPNSSNVSQIPSGVNQPSH